MDLMTDEMFAKITAAQAEIEAMKAANRLRADQGLADAYGEEHFYGIVEQMISICVQIANCYR